MPKPRAAKLETPTARRKLEVRKKPYWTTISPGIHLGYRRNQTAGTWSVRVADSGAEWIKKIALADDLEAASPPHVLSFGRRSIKRGHSQGGSRALPMMKAARSASAKRSTATKPISKRAAAVPTTPSIRASI